MGQADGRGCPYKWGSRKMMGVVGSLNDKGKVVAHTSEASWTLQVLQRAVRLIGSW